MIRTLLIGVSIGFVLAAGLAMSWQPQRVVRAEPSAQAAAAGAQPARDERESQYDRAEQRQFSPDLIERVIEVARRLDPPMAADLRALCNDHPEQIEHALRTTARRFVALADLQIRDPKLYASKMSELETAANLDRIAREFVAAREEGDESRLGLLEKELETAAQFHIAMTIKARGDSIRRLEEHVKALREELEVFAGNFQGNVRDRIEQAIERAERDRVARPQ